MKELFFKLDKIGLGIFIVTLINLVFILDRFNLFNSSKWQYIHLSLFSTSFIGLFLAFRSSWLKIIALLLSFSSLILLFDLRTLSNAQILSMLTLLPHMIATKSISISEIIYFVLFPIFIAFYCVFEISTALMNKTRKKLG